MPAQIFPLKDKTSIEVDIVNRNGHKEVTVLHRNSDNTIINDRPLLVFAPDQLKLEITSLGAYANDELAPVIRYIRAATSEPI